ncbi:cytochrome P450 [Cryphonectria parasitica EP155]|uniref:Cytochrome P450 n=1 Tax=Cryphonectria parasitica (strain ATCC 38755 / EP155) TaxID=660469 RepID=A0A9P4Y1K0_CRYP1|nr:cytochrome P450 [Cryphonectria parasitica EP155]KAF3764968.1 cytochrome P450 [Cryphonectria parasitica EP155]
MEKTVQKATVDVICRAALGMRLHSQTKPNEFVKILQDQVWWLTCDFSVANLLKEHFPLRPLITWNNNRKMRNFLVPLIEDGIAKFDQGEVSRVKTINDLAIKAYRTEVQEQSFAAGKPKGVDPGFLDVAVAQLKIFIFAGHDTTASTLSFAYSRLYSDPAALEKIRAEHDEVLGFDPSQAFSRLSENPNLLNSMPYTQAVVKEILRLYPPAATARTGDPNITLTNPDTGKVYPTDGFLMLSASTATHQHSDYWARADEFLPERWLVGEGNPLHPRKNAWRPFELGPRNCIGQELAQLELRAILAMTLRDLDLEPAYAADAPEAFGEKAYPVMGVGDITGHIKDGFPVRVHLRKGGKST